MSRFNSRKKYFIVMCIVRFSSYPPWPIVERSQSVTRSLYLGDVLVDAVIFVRQVDVVDLQRGSPQSFHRLGVVLQAFHSQAMVFRFGKVLWLWSQTYAEQEDYIIHVFFLIVMLCCVTHPLCLLWCHRTSVGQNPNSDMSHCCALIHYAILKWAQNTWVTFLWTLMTTSI